MLLLFGLALAGSPAARADAPAAEIAAAVRERLQGLATAGHLEIQGVRLGREDILEEFYLRRAGDPGWTDEARVDGLLDLLATSSEHGLNPDDFFLPQLRTPTDGSAASLAERDLLLTAALIRYGYQRRFGKVDPGAMDPASNFRRGFAVGVDPVTLLGEAMAAPSLAGFLDERIPGGPWYHLLQQALLRYSTIARGGGWPAVGSGPVLKAGDHDPRIALLRERLRVEVQAAPDPAPAAAELFDPGLEQAVRDFQRRHGLHTDGQVGPATIRALDVPAAARVDQLRLSLERVRWLTGDVPSTYVVVNVAGFRVGFVRDGQPVWNGRVVVGRAARQTPIFRDEITYVELNPTWTVPPTILREDVLPQVKHDPGYLRRENITVIDREGRQVDPHSVDWSAFTRNVPYTLRQEPGPTNSLGRIKIMFPNPHAIYLHDTPTRTLFDQPERGFSSGCIRVEDPVALAELLLADARWNRAALEAGIAEGKTRRIGLKRPMPVLLVYLTAVADADGSVRFYRDIYGRDAPLLAALNGPVRLTLPDLSAPVGAL